MTGWRRPDPARRRPERSDADSAQAPADEPAPPLSLPARALNEPESLAALAQAGLRVVSHALVHSADEAVAAAGHLGSAVVLKIVSADILH